MEPRPVNRPDWSRLANSRDLRELFASENVIARRKSQIRELRKFPTVPGRVEYANGQLDMLEFLEGLAARQAKLEADKRRAGEMDEQRRASQLRRFFQGS